jgi:hypothetical protein
MPTFTSIGQSPPLNLQFCPLPVVTRITWNMRVSTELGSGEDVSSNKFPPCFFEEDVAKKKQLYEIIVFV